MDTDFIAGQIDTLRTFVIALSLQLPDQLKLRETFRSLQQGLEDHLIAQPISESKLNGLRAEAKTLDALLVPVKR